MVKLSVMMWSRFCMIIFCCSLSFAAAAQDSSLQVQVNKSYFRPGETILINAKQASKKNATLFLMAEHEKGFVWEMRWPMLNGISEPTLILPDSMPQGQYRLFFSVLENLFTVFGRVKTPAKVAELSVTLLTAASDLYETDVIVGPDQRFVYKNVLFENDAMLIFTQIEKRTNQKLDIEISTVLDSAMMPLRNKTVDIYIGNTEPQEGIKPFRSINGSPDARAQTLAAVTVYNKPLNRGEVFNKKYSTGLFKDINERIFSFLDEPALANNFSLFQVLRGRVAGMNILNGPIPVVIWRGQPVAFYLDEMRVDAMTIESVSVQDIAIVKLFPPPFFGNPGGDGGAIAVYTKRGGLSDDNFRNAFRVKGYTPMTYRLATMPDKF